MNLRWKVDPGLIENNTMAVKATFEIRLEVQVAETAVEVEAAVERNFQSRGNSGTRSHAFFCKAWHYVPIRVDRKKVDFGRHLSR